MSWYGDAVPKQSSPQPLHDPRTLRAIAHPVRSRILSELTAQGSLRAADIAHELGIPANQASFHLRQLAKYGLIEEDPDAGRDRRDRVWRATSPAGFSVTLSNIEKQPGGKAASAVFRRSSRDWGHVIIDSVHAAEREPDVFASLTDMSLRLTKDEAAEFTRELNKLAEQWRQRNSRDRSATRRTYVYLGVVVPHPNP
jgi:predicted ArsR family transcriptional regulator